MRKKRHSEEPENHDRWLVSYADFITLLFAFFVVLYATSNRNEDKQREFQESLRKYMKIIAAVITPGGPGSGGSGSSVIDTLDASKHRTSENQMMEKELARIIESKLKPEERRELIPEIRADTNGVRIVLSATAFFPTGSAKMRFPATKALSSLAEALKKTPYRLIIEGHTDNQPLGPGQFETNWELAGARAASVVRFLAKVHGVDTRKMSAVSYADQRPVAPNDSEENRAKNRRIEILISTRDESEE